MTATTLTKTVAPGKWSTSGVVATMEVADTANDNDFAQDRDILLIVHNTGGSAYTVTITSEADPKYGRTGDVSAQSLAAGEIRLFRLTGQGWADSNGKINVSASNVAVKFGVIVL
jgi:hypothetical protein